MTLDIAQHIGTQPLPYGTANGRQMTETQELYSAVIMDNEPRASTMMAVTDDDSLSYTALVKTVYRLQGEVQGLAAQVVEMKAKMAEWEGDS
jgi:hypothetical protein